MSNELQAIRLLVAFNSGYESLKDVIDSIIDSEFIAPVKKEISKSSGETKELMKKQAKMWEDLKKSPSWKSYVYNKVVRMVKKSRRDAFLDDYISDAALELWKKRDNIVDSKDKKLPNGWEDSVNPIIVNKIKHKKSISPLFSDGKTLVQWISNMVGWHVMDLLRKDRRKSPYGVEPEKDDEETRQKVETIKDVNDPALQIQYKHFDVNDILSGLANKIKSMDKEGLFSRMYDLWVASAQKMFDTKGGSVKIKSILTELSKEFGFSEPMLYNKWKTLANAIIDYFNKVADVHLSGKLKKKLKLATEDALAFEQLCLLASNYVLGGIKMDMDSEGWMTPEDMVNTLRDNKQGNKTAYSISERVAASFLTE